MSVGFLNLITTGLLIKSRIWVSKSEHVKAQKRPVRVCVCRTYILAAKNFVATACVRIHHVRVHGSTKERVLLSSYMWMTINDTDTLH